MGCAPSGSVRGSSGNVSEHQDLTQWMDDLLSTDDPHTLLAAYVEIEREILNEESQSPGSAIGVAIAQQQQIKLLIQSASEKRDQNGGLFPQENSIYELFVDLGLHRSYTVAAEHEEFIATVNRRALNLNALDILQRRLTAVEERIHSISLNIGKLRTLYEKQDLLLGHIFGGMGSSDKERVLEEEIDTMRNYRDVLSNGVFLWQEAATNVHDAAELLTRGVTSWKSVQGQQSMERTISTATEARNAIQEAAILVEMSQDSIPGAQFPYCNKRELTSISQAIEYVFTDILIEDRYRHALHVYKNFQERASALWQWINQVMSTTLKKDLSDIDRNILGLSKNLRSERIGNICERLEIENQYSSYPSMSNIRPAITDKFHAMGKRVMNQEKFTAAVAGNSQTKDLGATFGLHTIGRMLEESNLHAEFERNLAARRDTMWPSRRIEELRMTLTSNAAEPS